jgi:hypothetical protein
VTAKALVAEIREGAERCLEASSTLIAVHLFAAGAEMVWRAIVMAAGYYVGSEARAPSKASVLSFIERYLPDLARPAPEGLALVERPRRPLASCAEVVYECWRGGLLHDGPRATGIEVVDDKARWMLSYEPGGSARLNAIPFQAQFERGLRHYLRALARDARLRDRAERRSAFLAKPTLVPPIP